MGDEEAREYRRSWALQKPWQDKRGELQFCGSSEATAPRVKASTRHYSQWKNKKNEIESATMSLPAWLMPQCQALEYHTQFAYPLRFTGLGAFHQVEAGSE
jgi:hypothetical protein